DVPFLKHAQHKSHETKPRTRPIALLVDRKRSRFSRVIVDEQRALLYSLAEFFFRDIGESLPDERDEFFLEAVDFSFGKDDVCDAQVSDSYEPADVLCPFAPGVLDQRLGEAEPDAFIEGILRSETDVSPDPVVDGRKIGVVVRRRARQVEGIRAGKFLNTAQFPFEGFAELVVLWSFPLEKPLGAPVREHEKPLSHDFAVG